VLAFAISGVHAQGTLSDYERAAVFQNARMLVADLKITPHWIAGTDSFWYLRKAGRSRSFIRVDPARKSQAPAFDHARLAAALSLATGNRYSADVLPFDAFEYQTGQAAIVFSVGNVGWRCALRSYTCGSLTHAPGARKGEARSPNGRWAVFMKDHNLWVRSTITGERTPLTSDGEPDHDYGSTAGISYSAVSDELLDEQAAPKVHFSPDSRRILTYQIDARSVQPLAVIQSVSGGRPVLHTYRYPIAGDRLVAAARMIVIDLESRVVTPLRYPPIAMITPYDMQVRWNHAGTHVCFTESERGYKTTKLQVADAQTGEVRTAVLERSATYVNPSFPAWILGEGNEVIWASERDGWNHLYRIDARTGSLLGQITRGEWVVRDIVHVDEKRGFVYFVAGGREEGQDPYYRHLYRVRLDGTGLLHLTAEPADHDVTFSPSGRYFLDTFSRIDSPPVSLLRAADGRHVRELQQADIARLAATGWKPPEPFSVKALDGRTRLYGAIFRPSNFDVRKHYPMLDSIYPGPQMIRTPKAFEVDKNFEETQALAELGFIVITLDGLGTPLRSRRFREFSYGNLGNAGDLENHIAAFRQLAERHPYMDVTRVGIYGNSGGGYASARAMLKFPDFYKVAVASAGNHDQRSYYAGWGELFQGFPVGDNYLTQTNSALAENLKGKLLLVHGDMDDNVHPSNTLQLADALIAANKDFDLLILPNRNHSLVDVGKGRPTSDGKDPYFLRTRWDFFVKHLLGVAPPKEFPLRAQGND